MEARRRFGEIMNRVALRGEEYTIARAGRALARIVPIERGAALSATEDVFDKPFALFDEWNDSANDPYDAL